MHRIYPKFGVLFSALFISALAFAQSPSIGVQVSPASFCIGDTMTVIFVTSDRFAPDNVFTIALSDSAGSFADGDTLDTITGQSGDTLYFVTPAVTASTLYKVNVSGSDPEVTGAPTINNITIKQQLPPPNIQLTPSGSVINLCHGDSVNFKFSSDTSIGFIWYFDDSLFTNAAHYTLTDKDSGTFVIEYTDTAAAGCSKGYDTVLVSVHAYPAKPTIKSVGPADICGAGAVKLYARNNPTLAYQWLDKGDTITGAADTSYIADSSGLYNLLASNNGCATASSPIEVNIDPNPIVTFSLELDSFCLNSPPISLSGGIPAGGYYTCSDSGVINGTLFEQSSSGLGTFTVYYTYSDSIGCKDEDSAQLSVYDCTTSGIPAIENEVHVNMYPNPASGEVIISTDNNSIKQVRILNLMGQELDHRQFGQQLIYATGNLPAGIYLVEVTDTRGTWKNVQKLVIQ